MSDNETKNEKTPKPPIDSITFVGYKGGELVWNTVETRPSKEEDVILLDAKVWPNVRKLAVGYDRIESAPFEVKDGELYAAAKLDVALKGMGYFYDKKIERLTRLRAGVVTLASALLEGEGEVLKEARVS
jgi:hypothetical protein